MSARRQSAASLVVLVCDHEGCTEKLITGQAHFKLIRFYALTQGWARRMKADFCKEHHLSGWPNWKERKAAKPEKVKKAKVAQYTYSAHFDGDHVVGLCAEFPKRTHRGAKTEQNAIKGIKKEIRRVLKEMAERGEAAPEPKAAVAQ